MSSEAVPTTNFRRLHITPFNSEIIDRILPSSLRLLAQNISFHTVQTLPEKGYGYVELPIMEAEKLKKKLNGTVLKGNKMRVEEAKPLKKRKSAADAEDEEPRETKKIKKVKKDKKQDQNVLQGFELPEGRHIERGWADKAVKKTQDKKAKDKRKKSKDVKDRKVLFKTVLPANVSAVAEPGKAKREKKDRKEKKGKKITLVDEFANTHRPSAGTEIDLGKVPQTTTFDEERGWVNAAGEVVEAAHRPKRPAKSKPKLVEVEQDGADSQDDDIQSSSSESSVLDESSVVSDDSESDGSEGIETPHLTTQQTSTKEVHPLEALFKRPLPETSEMSTSKLKPTAIDTSFSFFNSGVEEAEEDVLRVPPQTPHTKEDMEWRQVRSAAPTPDTAAIGKRFRFPTPVKNVDNNDDEESETMQEETAGPSDGAAIEESEFRKWFYENRGDLNRSWKKRRREERKAKRQRENRRISRRVV